VGKEKRKRREQKLPKGGIPSSRAILVLKAEGGRGKRLFLRLTTIQPGNMEAWRRNWREAKMEMHKMLTPRSGWVDEPNNIETRR